MVFFELAARAPPTQEQTSVVKRQRRRRVHFMALPTGRQLSLVPVPVLDTGARNRLKMFVSGVPYDLRSTQEGPVGMQTADSGTVLEGGSGTAGAEAQAGAQTATRIVDYVVTEEPGLVMDVAVELGDADHRT